MATYSVLKAKSNYDLSSMHCRNYFPAGLGPNRNTRFTEGIVLNAITRAIGAVFYMLVPVSVPFWDRFLQSVTYNLGFFVVCVFSYYLERKQKVAFYYNDSNKKKAEWSFNVIENMSTGFLSFKNDKVIYINSYLESKISIAEKRLEMKF